LDAFFGDEGGVVVEGGREGGGAGVGWGEVDLTSSAVSAVGGGEFGGFGFWVFF